MAANSYNLVEKTWDRIHSWMKIHSPNMLLLLRPGATELQIKELEKNLEIPYLPEDIRTSYKIHNGSTASVFFGVNTDQSFFSLEQIFDVWNDKMKAFSERPKNPETLWSNEWIPFGGNKRNCLICVDVAPAETCIRLFGEVFELGDYKDAKWTPYWYCFSFASLLEEFARHLEEGRYALSSDGKFLIGYKGDY